MQAAFMVEDEQHSPSPSPSVHQNVLNQQSIMVDGDIPVHVPVDVPVSVGDENLGGPSADEKDFNDENFDKDGDFGMISQRNIIVCLITEFQI